MTDHLKKHSEGTHNYCGICNKGNRFLSYFADEDSDLSRLVGLNLEKQRLNPSKVFYSLVLEMGAGFCLQVIGAQIESDI